MTSHAPLSKTTDKPFLYFAPLRGLTDCLFRDCFATHFSGFNSSIAPFINPQRGTKFRQKHLRDVLPENNNKMVVIPQLLNIIPEDFLALATRLEDLGYDHINWNLGCPAPMIVNKKRGSGFLAYPDEIIAFLEHVVPKLGVQLSIKTRLGFKSSDQGKELIPRLNDFPLKELIIHARLGKQLYKGTTDVNTFIECSKLTRHTLVYNGDITTPDVFYKLQTTLPDINRWMIGRGAIANPFLPEQIKGKKIDQDEKIKRLKSFHDDLYEQYQTRLSGDSHILGRMKQVWQYLVNSFPDEAKLLKRINKAKQLEKYETTVKDLF